MNETVYSTLKKGINLSGIKLSTGMHPEGFPPLTGEVLEDIVQRIVSHLQVEKIILFGSYTNPFIVPTSDSDIDILVIMESSETSANRTLTISRLLRPRPFPMDILVRTPQEIRISLENGDGFFQEIMTEGKIVYAR
jgi:uncharacterized protein